MFWGPRPPILINGSVESGFEHVHELFVKNFEDGKEENAQLCVYVDGERVVDLWGSATGDSSYGPNTTQVVWSAGKLTSAIAIASLVDQGRLSYSDPVVKHWPEFGQNLKEDVTIAKVMRHEAGMVFFQETIMLDWLTPSSIKLNKVGEIIEREIQHYPPESAGTDREYHPFTRGFILNEIYRRIDPAGRTIGEFIREDIAEKLGADCYCGLKQDQLSKSASLSYWSLPRIAYELIRPGGNIEQSFWETLKFAHRCHHTAPPLDAPPIVEGMHNVETGVSMAKLFNQNNYKTVEMPSANCQCSARGMAKIAAAMANKGELDGKRIMKEKTWDEMHADYTEKWDYSGLFAEPIAFSQGGICNYEIDDQTPHLTLERCLEVKKMRRDYLGWQGHGGSIWQWCPELKIGFAYVPTLMFGFDPCNTKAARLQELVVNCVRNRDNESENEEEANE